MRRQPSPSFVHMPGICYLPVEIFLQSSVGTSHPTPITLTLTLWARLRKGHVRCPRVPLGLLRSCREPLVISAKTTALG